MADDGPGADLEAFYRADQISAAAAQEDHAVNLDRFGKILAAIEKQRAPGRLLDVGCSIGTSLLVAKQRGWQPIGLELSAAATAIARDEHDLDVREQTLGDSGIEPGSIDAVLMHHTLEHVDAPDQLLREAFAVLAPGGVMYQSLPNHGSWKAALLGRHFGYGITDEHVSHFTRKLLCRLVRRVGFDVVRTETWSYCQDPRLLHDVCARFGRQRWLARRCGIADGEALEPRRYIDFLNRTRWAFWFCNGLWPHRLCRGLRGGEDLHLIARKPDSPKQ